MSWWHSVPQSSTGILLFLHQKTYKNGPESVALKSTCGLCDLGMDHPCQIWDGLRISTHIWVWKTTTTATTTATWGKQFELLEIYLYITSIYEFALQHHKKNIWLFNIDLHFFQWPRCLWKLTWDLRNEVANVSSGSRLFLGIPEPILVGLGNGWCYGAPWIPSIYPSHVMYAHQHHGSWVMVRIEIRIFLGSSGSIPYCTFFRPKARAFDSLP